MFVYISYCVRERLGACVLEGRHWTLPLVCESSICLWVLMLTVPSHPTWPSLHSSSTVGARCGALLGHDVASAPVCVWVVCLPASPDA